MTGASISHLEVGQLFVETMSALILLVAIVLS